MLKDREVLSHSDTGKGDVPLVQRHLPEPRRGEVVQDEDEAVDRGARGGSGSAKLSVKGKAKQ